MPKPNEKFTFADDTAPAKPAPTKQDHAQKLLDWLQRWPKPTVSTKNICQFGPYPLRNGESALRSAQVLAAHGWLIPLAARKWQVVRGKLVSHSVAGS
jgi:hypothetical protein